MWGVWVVSVLAMAAAPAWAAEPAPVTEPAQEVFDPPLRCQNPRCRLLNVFKPTSDYTYSVDGHTLIISVVNHYLYEDQKFLTLTCHDDHYTRKNTMTLGASRWALDSPSLPRAEPPLRVLMVGIYGCRLPEHVSLADIFTTIGVTLQDASDKARSTLLLNLHHDEPPLNPKHFAGLDFLSDLEIWSNKLYNRHQTRSNPSEISFTAPLRNLRRIVIWMSAYELPMVASLEKVRMYDWKEENPARMERCDSLRWIEFDKIHAVTLPESWLANCGRLEELVINKASNLVALLPNILLGASAIKYIHFSQMALETLPAGFLDHTPKIAKFIIDRSSLKTLPSGLFNISRHLKRLNLSNNKLDTRAVAELAPLQGLEWLDLSHNTQLGDFCDVGGYSPLRNSTQLTDLYLRDTAVSRICRDWREDLVHLEYIYLTGSRVSQLTFDDLQFTRSNKIYPRVALIGVTPSLVSMTEENYNMAARGRTSNTTVSFTYDDEVTGRMKCDCRMYWTRRALDLQWHVHLPPLFSIGSLKCSDNRELFEVRLEEMTCDY